MLRELVAAAGADGERIGRLQRACLVPYELSLMSPRNRSTTPVDVVAEVVCDLRNFPIASDR